MESWYHLLLCKLGQGYWLYRRAQFYLPYFVLFEWDVILFSAWRMSFDGTYLTAILVKVKEHTYLNLWRILIASCIGVSNYLWIWIIVSYTYSPIFKIETWMSGEKWARVKFCALKKGSLAMLCESLKWQLHIHLSSG